MFTLQQIEQAHAQVGSGADFPRYIGEITALGVTSYEVGVADGHTEYSGGDGFRLISTHWDTKTPGLQSDCNYTVK